MAGILFITTNDDECLHLYNEENFRAIHVRCFPSAYRIGRKTYIDHINTNSMQYDDFIKSGNDVSSVMIPVAVYEHLVELAYRRCFFAIVFILPHSRFSTYKKTAEDAIERFFSKNEEARLYLRTKVYDSKHFGAGVVYMGKFFAETYLDSRHSVDTLFSLMDYFAEVPLMYVLSQGPCVLGGGEGLNAFLVRKDRVKNLKISDYPDPVIFDKFSDAVCADLKKYARNAVVSLGCDCTFAGNVLGRIEQTSGKNPLCTVQYGVCTAGLLGTNAMCISLI